MDGTPDKDDLQTPEVSALPLKEAPLKHDNEQARERTRRALYEWATYTLLSGAAATADAATNVYENVSQGAGRLQELSALVQQVEPTPVALISFGLLLIGGMYYAGTIAEKSKKSAEKNRMLSETGFYGERYVCEGKKPFKIGDIQLNQGDNFLYVNFPGIRRWGEEATDEMDPQVVRAQHELKQLALEDLRKQLGKYDAKAVVIEFDDEDIDKEQFRRITTPQELFADHNSKIKQQKGVERRCVVVTQQELEDIRFASPSKFNDAVKQIPDEEFQEYLEIARSVPAFSSEQTKAIQLMKLRLLRLLNIDISRENDNPERGTLSIDRTTGERNTQRYDSFSRVIRDPLKAGDLNIRITTGNDVRFQQLAQRLGLPTVTKYDPNIVLQETIDAPPGDIDKPEKIIYLVYQLLETLPLDVLVQEQIFDIKTVDNDLFHLGYGINRQGDHEKHLFQTSDTVIPRRFKEKSIPIARAMLVFALARSVILGGGGVLSIIQTDHTLNQPIISLPNSEQQTSLIPLSGIEWNVEEHGISQFGFYITSTSYNFEHGQWQTVTERQNELHLPNTFTLADQPYLSVSRNLEVDAFSQTSFKLPILNYEGVAALRITDQNGNVIHDYTTYELTDGTIEVVIHGGPFSQEVHIEEWLNNDGDYQYAVHATGNVQKIDLANLTPALRQEIENINAENIPEDAAIGELIQYIQANHDYSIANVRNFDGVTDSASYADIVSQTHGINCEEASNLLVFLSTVDPQIHLNVALGFYNGTANGAANGDLRSDAFHQVGITQFGTIEDPTPLTLANDPPTEQYAKQLAQPVNQNIIAAQQQEISNDLLVRNAMETMVALISVTGGLMMISKAGKEGRRIVSKQNVAYSLERLVDRAFTDNDFRDAYEYLSWVSWADTTKKYVPSRSFPEDYERRFKTMDIAQNTYYQKLLAYIKNPRDIDRIGDLTMLERVKMRLLAGTIILRSLGAKGD